MPETNALDTNPRKRPTPQPKTAICATVKRSISSPGPWTRTLPVIVPATNAQVGVAVGDRVRVDVGVAVGLGCKL
ncbi:MAG: hypothetical protein H6631_16445 [Anaerolineaceae bacterium]|nr:hypothetical protein [Anaerolineaceae bacterium]